MRTRTRVQVDVAPDGSMQFSGTARTVDIDVARRQIVDTLGMITKFLPFSEVHQVILSGPASARLSLQLSLRSGERLEIGVVEDMDFGTQLGTQIAGLLGCTFGGVVRLPGLRFQIQPTGETEAFAHTAQIYAADVLRERAVSPAPNPLSENAPTQEVPALRRAGVLSLFDEAARDLLDHTWD